MAGLARVIVPGIPHRIAQRGNRRQEVFFREENYQEYLDTVERLLMRVDDWKEFITAGSAGNDDLFLRHQRTGRPLGDKGFVQRVSQLIGRDLMPKKPGRKKEGK